MGWIFLLLAGSAEIFWAVSLNYINGPWGRLAVTGCVLGLGLSIFFMWLAIRTIPLSVAYAIWTGIGIVGVYAFGIFVMKDALKFTDGLFVFCILIGIIGLKLSNNY